MGLLLSTGTRLNVSIAGPTQAAGTVDLPTWNQSKIRGRMLEKQVLARLGRQKLGAWRLL